MDVDKHQLKDFVDQVTILSTAMAGVKVSEVTRV